MATLFLPADLSALHRWAYLLDLFYREELTASLYSELRQIEERFFITPDVRRRGFIEVAEPGAEPPPKPEEEPERPAQPARAPVKLRAV